MRHVGSDYEKRVNLRDFLTPFVWMKIEIDLLKCTNNVLVVMIIFITL